ncbi:MAG TPA: divalent-cation tolerance protein CutA [Asticcacaulis sp.]|nr:divalent-cation tolerance protein CutA [Asticcacaulis sp.]
MTDLLTVSIACGSDAEAQTLARLLVEHKLAACCQTHPIQSTYRWHGAIETASEVMLAAKTLADKLPALEAFVKQHHSYDVPEILAVPVAWASADYVQWLRDSLAE